MRGSQSTHQRREAEQGALHSGGRRRIALVYPSPYTVGMSSLGFQSVYRLLNHLPDTAAERAFLPDADDPSPGPVSTFESGRPIGDFQVAAFSVAYELELTGLFACLEQSGIPAHRAHRTAQHPVVVAGGPLTFSNPRPLGPFADVVVVGEAEEALAPLVDTLFGLPKADALRVLADLPGFWVPAHHGDALPSLLACDDALLPAVSQILTPHTELSNMFLVEPARGCSRGCSFCVMRRSTNGGMRIVSPQRVLDAVPSYATKVGLVGAAVSDHPRMTTIMEQLIDRGLGVSLSSLRADRLTPEFVHLLVRGGYRTLTVASDGASERLRDGMEKRIREKHLLRAAELAREAGIPIYKMYMMIGVPSETDADIDELVDFCRRLSSVLGPRARLAMGVAPFVSKHNTPLDGMPWAGIREVDRRLAALRAALEPQVEVRPTSSRWAWVEYCLAQGGMEAGEHAYRAWRDGGRFAHWKRAFAHVPMNPEPREVALPSPKRRRLPVLEGAVA